MKSAIVAIFAVTISMVLAQPSVMRDQDCQDNEGFQTCGSACEPSCDNPNPSFCTLQCVVGCQCDKGFVRNANKQCIKLEECNAVTTQKPTATVSSTPVKCATNETFLTCHSPCSEKKCAVKNAPVAMCMMLCQQGCGCSEGFSRNTTGFCIKDADCPKIDNSTTENSCNLIDCKSGLACQVQNGVASCVAATSPSVTCSMIKCKSGSICRDIQGKGQCIPTGITEPVVGSCMTMRCGTAAGCAMVIPAGCASGNCTAQPTCINTNPCAVTMCSSGKSCVLRQVTCVKEPCNPIAECVTGPPVDIPTCPLNEELVPCLNACSDTECGQTEPRMCTRECRGPGCACSKGFFRDASGSCVNQQKCDDQAKACASMSCPTGTKCLLQQIECITTPCNPIAVCQSVNDNCTTQGGCDTEPVQATNGTKQNTTFIPSILPALPFSNLSAPINILPFPMFNGTTSAHLLNGSILLPTVIPKSNLSLPVTAKPFPMFNGTTSGHVLNGSMVPPAVTPRTNITGFTAPPVMNVPNGCQNVTCPTGEVCEQARLQCQKPPCNWVSCVPLNPSHNSTVTDGCAVVKCDAGETCRQTAVQCFAAPCPVQISCIKYVNGNNTDNDDNYNYHDDAYNYLDYDNEHENHTHNGSHTDHGNWTTGGLDPAFNGTGSNGRCDVNETLSDCYNKCSEKKCPGVEQNMFCTKHCGVGCECKDGFLRTRDGNCVSWDDCPEESACGKDEEYRCEKCDATCKNPEPNCNTKNCKKTCKCAVGFVKLNGKCETLDSCPSHQFENTTCLATEDYTDCVPKCHLSCTGSLQCDTKINTKKCEKGCACRNKYRKNSNGTCVHNRHCFKTTDCPENEVWEKCRDNENTCDGILTKSTPAPVHDTCYSGCACDSGFARNHNGTCVAFDKC